MEELLHHNAWDEEYNIHHIDALRGKAFLEACLAKLRMTTQTDETDLYSQQVGKKFSLYSNKLPLLQDDEQSRSI